MLPKMEISATELQVVAERIKLLRRKATEHAVEIGHELLHIKASLPHGVFVKWVENACGFKIRTAQDLMKLAREADSNAQLVALMVPSTLRVYLSKTTPVAVRNKILARLQNGERVSRNELHSVTLAARSTRQAESGLAQNPPDCAHFTSPDLLTAADTSGGSKSDRSRTIAELLVRRLSKADYEFVMDGLSWEGWNRVFVWMRAARVMASDQVDSVPSLRFGHPSLPAATHGSP